MAAMSFCRTFALALAGALTFALPAGLALAAQSLPPDGQLDYGVWRDDEEIGSHRITFRHEGDSFYVDIVTEISVDFSFVTLYNFDYDGQEIWRGGQFSEISTTSDNDGIEHSLQAYADGARLRVIVDGVESHTQTANLVADLWGEDAMAHSSLLNGLDGTEMTVSIQDMGLETLDIGSGPIQARHYSVTGDLRRELWYDAGGLLAKMRLWGDDESEVDYILQ